jgi:hypothetical protein
VARGMQVTPLYISMDIPSIFVVRSNSGLDFGQP